MSVWDVTITKELLQTTNTVFFPFRHQTLSLRLWMLITVVDWAVVLIYFDIAKVYICLPIRHWDRQNKKERRFPLETICRLAIGVKTCDTLYGHKVIRRTGIPTQTHPLTSSVQVYCRAECYQPALCVTSSSQAPHSRSSPHSRIPWVFTSTTQRGDGSGLNALSYSLILSLLPPSSCSLRMFTGRYSGDFPTVSNLLRVAIQSVLTGARFICSCNVKEEFSELHNPFIIDTF